MGRPANLYREPTTSCALAAWQQRIVRRPGDLSARSFVSGLAQKKTAAPWGRGRMPRAFRGEEKAQRYC